MAAYLPGSKKSAHLVLFAKTGAVRLPKHPSLLGSLRNFPIERFEETSQAPREPPRVVGEKVVEAVVQLGRFG